jgi:hypothetical protein
MSCRKWVVRGLVLLVFVGCVGIAVVYQQWTNPETVRQQVVDMLHQQFPTALVTLDSARLRLFGGVVLSELRLVRDNHGNPAEGEGELLHVPQATVYHDKERLLKGEFAIRRIDLQRPSVRIIRDKAGKWNLEGLTGKSNAHATLPTMVIHDGTAIIEDHFAGPVTWEVHGLQLTLLNDAADCISFSGVGKSEVFGELQIRGSYNRRTSAAVLNFKTAGLNLTSELVQYVVNQCPGDHLAGLQMTGRADIQLDLSYQPTAGSSSFALSSTALKYDVHCKLNQARIAHPKLPLPVYNLTASLHCTEGELVLERLKAAAGDGKVEAKATAKLPYLEKNFTAEVTVYHLPVEKALIDKLHPKVGVLYERFRPEGTAKGRFVFEMKDGHPLRKSLTFEPDEMSVCFWKFPYQIDHVTGALDYDFLQERSKFDVVGYSGAQPVNVRGYWKGVGKDSDAVIEIAAADIPLDQKLLNALVDQTYKDLATSFHPTGRGHIRANVRRVPGIETCQSTYQIHFVDAAIKWDKFPYPLENVEGDLVIYPEGAYEFKNFHGNHHGGDVWVQGHKENDGPLAKLLVNVAGQNICLDEDMHQALAHVPDQPKLGGAWKTFSPAGRVGFRVDVEQVPNRPSNVDLTIDVAGCAIHPNFFPYDLHDVTGQFRYHKDKVELTHFTARHDTSQVSIDSGTVDLYDMGGYYVELHELRANPILADAALLKALPEKVRATVEAINLKDQPFAMDMTKLIVSQGSSDALAKTQIYWDGLFWVRDAELRAGIDLNHVTGTIGCQGLYDGTKMVRLGGNVYFSEATVYKQAFKDVRSRLEIKKDKPEVLHFSVAAPIDGGDISGQGLIEFNDELRYEVDLTASEIQLAEFGKHNFGPNQQLKGFASSRLHLQGRGDAGLEGLKGNGSIDVPYTPMTRLLNLPLLLDLLKFLGLRWPDRTAFEEAHADFAIEGNRVSINKLELLGNAVSLYGKGEVNLDGTDVDLKMYPSWGRAEQMLPSGVRNIPSEISKQLLMIDVRGKVSGDSNDLKFSKRPVPGLIDPLVQMRDRIVGKQ